MKYVDMIDEEFVLNFAKENLKDVYEENTITVKKVGYMFPEWVVLGTSKKYNATMSISFTDFKAVADGEPLDSKISKLWCKALNEKFKDEYIEALNANKIAEEKAKYKREGNKTEFLK